MKLNRIALGLIAAITLTLAPRAAATGTTNGASTYLETQLLNLVFRTQVAWKPGGTWLGLFTTCPSTAGGGSGTEVSTTTTGYGRVQITQADATWSISGVPVVISNTGTLTAWASAPAGASLPVTVNCWGIWDAQTTGNLLAWGQLATPKTINAGDAQPTFAAGQLTITLD